MFCAVVCQLRFQLYYLVVTAESESSIRNKKYANNYSFMLSASKAVTTVLACTQMVLQFNGETKSLLVTQSVPVEQSRNKGECCRVTLVGTCLQMTGYD